MEIKIENLTKAYGDFKAVDNMNLNIADGELVGLLGPSGCGKSTTLFMLAGLNDPTSGHIYFGGKDVRLHRRIVRSALYSRTMHCIRI